MQIAINLLLAIHVIVALLIILVVLMQRPKNEGLGAAFGGGMTDNIFGAQTTNVLQGFTRWLGGFFFALSLLLSFLYARQSSQRSAVEQELHAASAVPAAAALPAATPGPTPASATPTPAPSATPASSPVASPAPAASATTPTATP